MNKLNFSISRVERALALRDVQLARVALQAAQRGRWYHLRYPAPGRSRCPNDAPTDRAEAAQPLRGHADADRFGTELDDAVFYVPSPGEYAADLTRSVCPSSVMTFAFQEGRSPMWIRGAPSRSFAYAVRRTDEDGQHGSADLYT